MTGPGFFVSTETLADVAKHFNDIGEHLDSEAKKMRSLEISTGSNAVFGVQINESVVLGGKYNDLLNLLAAYGEMLGETLKLWSLQVNASGNAYAENERATAAKLGEFDV